MLRPVLLYLAAGTAVAEAQQIYKSVDADGVITYSASPARDTPADRVETVKVDPAPPEQERAAAEERPAPAHQGVISNGSRTLSGAEPSAGEIGIAATVTDRHAAAAARAEQLQRARSSSRTSRPAGGSGIPERDRNAGQIPSNRTRR